MLEILFRLALAGVLAGAALAKLARPGSSRAALGTFGFSQGWLRDAAWAALIATELGLAIAVAAGLDGAAYGAAALMALFAALTAGALLRGLAGAPCACFGARSTVSWLGMARNLALAAGFAAIPWLPSSDPSTEAWLAAGIVLALAACAALAVSVLALAREVGMLRLQLGTQGALEIAGEGPEVGDEAQLLAERIPLEGARLALGVFSSEGCHICQTLAPAIESVAKDPLVAVGVFDEAAEAELWRELGVPGSPFAVALDERGTVLAKGTFNNLAQLESVLATAERRRSSGFAEAGIETGRGRSGDFRSVPEHLDRISDTLARDTSRRGFLARVGAALVGATAARTVGTLIEPGDSDAFHFCGHIFTTGSCPHPTGLPRIDGNGFALRASDGKPVDDTGRVVDAAGLPVDESGQVLKDPDGRPLPPAPRTRVCDRVQAIYGIRTRVDASWYRCCGGKVRRLVDCCSRHSTRINGDAALTGYCFAGRKVFCVLYYDTQVPC